MFIIPQLDHIYHWLALAINHQATILFPVHVYTSASDWGFDQLPLEVTHFHPRISCFSSLYFIHLAHLTISMNLSCSQALSCPYTYTEAPSSHVLWLICCWATPSFSFFGSQGPVWVVWLYLGSVPKPLPSNFLHHISNSYRLSLDHRLLIRILDREDLHAFFKVTICFYCGHQCVP